MKLQHLFKTEGKVVLRTGQARLLAQRGKFKLVGGSKDDQTEIKEIVALFLHDVVMDLPD